MKNPTQNVYFTLLLFLIPSIAVFSSRSSSADDWRPVRSPTSSRTSETNNAESPILTRITRMDSSQMALEYSMPTPVTEPSGYRVEGKDLVFESGNAVFLGSSWETIKLGSAPVRMIAGEPMLPFVTANLILPRGFRVKRASMIPGELLNLPGSHNLEPAEKPFPLMPGVEIKKTLPKSSIYLSDRVFPEKNVEIVGTHKSRGIPVFTANLFPVKYNPVQRKIYYYRTFSLEVELEPAAAGEIETPIRPSKVFSPSERVENPELLEEYKVGEAERKPSEPKYIIVTKESFASETGPDSLEAFREHKSSLGIETAVHTMESIESDYPGVDEAEKLRNFIIDMYEISGIEYVLLVGDAHVVPDRQLWVVGNDPDEPEPYIDNMPSDLYFACLDGTFNDDGDDQWGEPEDGENGDDVDLLFDVYVGRVLADGALNVSNWVNKTIRFENENPGGDFMHANLMVGEYLGFGGDSDYATGQLEEIVHGSSEHGFTTVGFDADSSFTTETLYADEDYWGPSDVLAKMNSDSYAWYNHLGHAYTDTVMTLQGSDVVSLSNEKPFFIYSQGCYAGSFDESECMAEFFTTIAKNGASAVVFNARYGFGLSYSLDGPSNRYHREFWDAVFGEGKTVLGEVHADHKEDLVARINEDVMRWVYYETNLFGDPSVQIIRPGSSDADSDSDSDSDSDADSDSDIDTDTDSDADTDTDTDADTDADTDTATDTVTDTDTSTDIGVDAGDNNEFGYIITNPGGCGCDAAGSAATVGEMFVLLFASALG